MRKIFFLFVLLLMGNWGYSQKFSFLSYSTEEGLPQSQVTAITQGQDGYLWVGTLGGLAKFNGKEFVTFSINDGLLNNRVTSLCYFDGAIWVGHDGGISKITPKKVLNAGFKGDDKSRQVSEILKFKDQIVVCTREGGLFLYDQGKLKNVEVDNREIDRIRGAYVHGGLIFLATRGGVLVSSDLKNFHLVGDLGENSFSEIDGDGKRLVFSSFNSLLFVKDLETEELKSYDMDTLRVSGVYIDHKGRVWMNTDGGIVRMEEDESMTLLNTSKGLPVNMTSCFFEDKDENIWIGSQGKGVFRFPGQSFQYFDKETGFPTDLFLNGFQDKSGDFYYGTYEKGVLRKKSNGEVQVLDVGEDVIWASVMDVDGKNWFGAQNSLISISKNNEIEIFDREDHVPGSKITALYKIDAKSMYVGGNDGMAIYKGGEFVKLGKRDIEFLGTVRDIEVVDNVLYCVSNLGLFVFKEGDFHQVKGVDQVLYSLETDHAGNLWLGAEEGLYRYRDGKLEKINLLNDDPGSNFINFLNYNKHELYVGTNNGLFVLSQLSGKIKSRRYGIGDGIPDLETNLNSGFFDNEENFWFGTASGLVCFHTRKKPRVPAQPILNLKEILLNYESFDYSNYSHSVDVKGLPMDLDLPYSKNNLIIDLDGVSLVNYRGLKYQYLLEGLNSNWSPLSDVSSITFTRLPAGSYKLRIRAVDIDGRMSKEVVLPLVVQEAFYKTWWFITLCILFVGAVVFFFFRFRVNRINERNEKEKLVFKTRLLALEQKSINASMNRHFIFNALNSIQYFINTQDRLSANKYLTNFAQLISQESRRSQFRSQYH